MGSKLSLKAAGISLTIFSHSVEVSGHSFYILIELNILYISLK